MLDVFLRCRRRSKSTGTRSQVAVKGLNHDAQHTCEPIIGLVSHMPVEVGENSNVLFPVVSVMTAY